MSQAEKETTSPYEMLLDAWEWVAATFAGTGHVLQDTELIEGAWRRIAEAEAAGAPPAYVDRVRLYCVTMLRGVCLPRMERLAAQGSEREATLARQHVAAWRARADEMHNGPELASYLRRLRNSASYQECEAEDLRQRSIGDA